MAPPELLIFYIEILKNRRKKAHCSLCLHRRLFGSSNCFDYFFVLGLFFSLSCGLFLGKFLKKKNSPEKPQSTGKGQEQTKEEGYGPCSSGIELPPTPPKTLPRVLGLNGQDGTLILGMLSFSSKVTVTPSCSCCVQTDFIFIYFLLHPLLRGGFGSGCNAEAEVGPHAHIRTAKDAACMALTLHIPGFGAF